MSWRFKNFLLYKGVCSSLKFKLEKSIGPLNIVICLTVTNFHHRIQEFHRGKAERAAKAKEEIHQEFLRKEREKERVAEQALQARELQVYITLNITPINYPFHSSIYIFIISHLQAQIDELNASRIQEEVEREWRRREKEEAVRRAETQKRLRNARDQQISNKIHQQAMEIEREKREFEKILAMQKEAICREERERERRRRQALAHRSEILKQVGLIFNLVYSVEGENFYVFVGRKYRR